MATKSLVLALFVALAFGSAAAQQFPCVEITPCIDDPTFLIFGIFPCNASPFDPCTAPDSAAACGLTCFTCPICEDPDPVPGFDIVLQSAMVAPGVLSVFIDGGVTVAGVQGVLSCISAADGEDEVKNDRARKYALEESSPIAISSSGH